MTIRLRLTLWYTALLGATLILFSVLVYSALAATLNYQFIQSAANQANLVKNAIRAQLIRDVQTWRNPRLPNLNLFSLSLGVQTIDVDGQVMARSVNLEALNIPVNQVAVEAIRNNEEHAYYIAATIDGRTVQFLVYSVPLVVGNTLYGAVQIVKPPADGSQQVLGQVSRYLTFGTAFSLLIAAVVGAILARRTLAPIDEITRTASSITRAKDLGQRLDIPEDASEVGQLAATFNEMLDRIQKLFTTQERLIADVSHELRTPLTTIQGNMDLLQRMANLTLQQATQQTGVMAGHNQEPRPSGYNPEVNSILPEILSEVENETARMGRMIGDLLLLAQADSGVLQLKLDVVEMDTLLLEVFRQGRRVAERMKGPGALEFRLGHEDQAQVWGDRERLRQLLLNLVDNAIKYTPSGGVVTLSLESKDGWVHVSVQDTGIGIRAEDQNLVFERFYRTDKARSREMGGSGLGLSIVHWIAQAHQGRISVESALQKGSTFTLSLPEYSRQGEGVRG